MASTPSRVSARVYRRRRIAAALALLVTGSDTRQGLRGGDVESWAVLHPAQSWVALVTSVVFALGVAAYWAIPAPGAWGVS